RQLAPKFLDSRSVNDIALLAPHEQHRYVYPGARTEELFGELRRLEPVRPANDLRIPMPPEAAVRALAQILQQSAVISRRWPMRVVRGDGSGGFFNRGESVGIAAHEAP